MSMLRLHLAGFLLPAFAQTDDRPPAHDLMRRQRTFHHARLARFDLPVRLSAASARCIILGPCVTYSSSNTSFDVMEPGASRSCGYATDESLIKIEGESVISGESPSYAAEFSYMTLIGI